MSEATPTSTSPTHARLKSLAHAQNIPIVIMEWLVNQYKAFENVRDLIQIPETYVQVWETQYRTQYASDTEHLALWTPMLNVRLEHLIRWVRSYVQTYHALPQDQDINAETMMVLPEYWEHSPNFLSSPTKILSPQRSASPSANRYQHVTTRFSTGSSGSHRSNYSTLARRNVKISITDYPKFSGKARDWQTFDRKFNSVAATQGYAYILASEEYQPTSEEDKEVYQR
jgi:hypothetical protein